MAGLGIAPVPCIRCKARRVKCDKRQPGCARCEKSAQPCPGYNRVRKFLDEGENLRHKIAKATTSRRSDASSSSVPRDVPPEETPVSVKQDSPKASITASHRPRTDDTNGAGIDPAIIHGHSPLAGGQPKPEDISSLAFQPAASLAMITPRSFSDLDFDAAYFDIDPQVYYADPINCCLLIPDASQADDDEFMDVTQASSAMLSPITSFDPSVHSGGSSLSAPDDQDEEDEEHEASHLIRYFADFTSQWLDIFDIEKFFGNVVPVRAVHSALLKNSLAAVAAKQFGSLRKASGAHSPTQPSSYPPHDQNHWRSTLDIHFDKSGPEWFYKAASFYDKAIGQMMASLQTLRVCCSPGQPFPNYAADAQNLLRARSENSGTSPLESPQRPTSCEDVADDLLAAISVFLLYEALDNRQAEMMQHMKGAQYLLTLDVDQSQRLCNANDKSCPRIASSLTPTKAWVASFWNFAWVDYVVSYTRHTTPHIDTENMAMWKAAGLPLCDFGGLCVPETTLLWIVLETLKFVAWTEMEDKAIAAQEENPWPGRTRQHQRHPSYLRPQRWHRIRQHLESWKVALPVTFEPCVRIPSHGSRRSGSTDPKATPLPSDIPELFYSNAMCATAALLYHVTQIILMLHKPADRGQSTTRLLHAQRQTSARIEEHAREICALALGQSTLAVRMHMSRPLHLAGLCLQTKEHRHLLVDLLTGIERDTGYSTEWTIDLLRNEWGWSDANRSENAPDVRLRRRT
ncbi:N-terminal fungal transcription regulatory domain-containing protein [Purpureocillium lavendulum]|uniref:N-terminal fungal transcription regulatory domain-containing protein n=1 Tax=Purpureocillium lavendulum TaxID=1247861 RepID=A0AB34G520_9HYPO|nr:N-terminal fungal transcription regulatory domain-containing protein [Purpureocillium lavendulum]